MNYLRRILLLGLGLILLNALPIVASAQVAGEGMQVKPAVVEDNVSPGEVYHFDIQVTNIGSTDKTFYLSTEDISGLSDQGQPIFSKDEPTTYQLSKWIQLPGSSITVKAGASQTMTLAAVVPSDASPGSHFGAVFLADKPEKPGTTGAGVGFTVGTIISLTIAGNVTDQASLREFSTGKFVYGSPDVDFNSKIENQGNVLVRPHGVIVISDMFGREAGTISVNDSAAPVFPGSDRIYTADWNTAKFAFGRYQATGSFSYGEDEKKTISGTTSFWVLPLKPILVLLGILFGIVILMYASIQMYIKKKLTEMGATGKADASIYAKRYQRSGSRLIIVTLAIFLVCVIFLAVVFLAFA